MNETAPCAEKSDRCQRWRKIAIDQLGYLINLTLTFTIAALGYCFVLLKDRDFTPGSSAKVGMIISMLALALAAMFGFACALTRLLDFRGSARRACDHPKKPSQDAMRELDNLTWVLFYLQSGGFATGIVALAITANLWRETSVNSPQVRTVAYFSGA
jgi:hypothetical protein